MNTIGERLKILRNNRGLSQRDLARSLNVSPSTVAQYETGKRTPDADTLNALAQYFNVSVDYLLGRTDDPRPPKRGDKYAWINKIPPHLREELEKSIDKYMPFFRMMDNAILNELDPLTLEQVAKAIIDGKRRDEEAPLRNPDGGTQIRPHQDGRRQGPPLGRHTFPKLSQGEGRGRTKRDSPLSTSSPGCASRPNRRGR